MPRQVFPPRARYLAPGVLLAVLACSSETVFVEDTQVWSNRSPAIVAYVPDDVTLVAKIDEPVEFSLQANDPDGNSLSYWFTIEDSLVTNSSSFVFSSPEPRFICVRAHVTDGEYSLMHNWLLTVIVDPETGDSIAPATVENLSVEPEGAPGKVIVRWRAVGDDGLEGRANRYVVGTNIDPIIDEWTWQNSGKIAVDGTEADPGVAMSKVVTLPEAAQYTTAVVRAIDDSGNISPIGEYAEGFSNRSPEIVAYVPDDVTPVAKIDEPVEFSLQANDPDGNSLSYWFTIEDSLVTNSSSFVFSSPEPRFICVRAHVTDGEYSLMHNWLLTVIVDPETGDSIAPATVENLSVEPEGAPGKVIVRWRAVGDDGLEGRANRYVVGTNIDPIIDEWTWQNSGKIAVDGTGADPGVEMSKVVTLPEAAQYTTAVVRAIDDSWNISPIGEYAEGFSRGFWYSGQVLELLTGDPIAGAFVTAGTHAVVTDVDGHWAMEEMPFVAQEIVVSDDGVEGEIGDYYDFLPQEPISHNAFHLVYLFPHYPLQSTRYTGFLQFFVVMTDNPAIPYPTYLRHWDLPINVYAEPATYGDLDYKATVERVAVELNDHLGFAAFQAVESPPDTGVVCTYSPDVYSDHFGYREFTEDWYPVKGEIEFRTIWTAGNVILFERIIRHELGHALGLRHSLDPIHLMVGYLSPQVANFSEEELNLLTLMYYFTGEMAVGSYIED